MYDWIRRKLEQLLDTLVDPLWRWCLALPWAGRLAVLFFIVTASGAALHWERTLGHIDTGVYLLRALASDGHEGVPISESHRQRTLETIDRLTANLQADIVSRGQPGHESWSTSQTVVALGDLSLFPVDELTAFFRSQVDSTCSCWKEFPRSGAPRHIPASAWVLFAMARMQSSVANEEISFVLKHQHKGGWWPMYPSREDAGYASTYATAWALLALNEHLSRDLVSRQNKSAVDGAIARGHSWLTSHREPSRSRWKDYPLSVTGKVSESISGLVMFVLHSLDRTSMVELDRQWLVELPASLPSPNDCEIPLVWTNTLDGRQLDAYCQLRLPWLLIGTLDAYANGTLLQRAKALGWLERAIDQTNILHSDTLPENWNRSEVLISLRHLLRKKTANSGKGQGARINRQTVAAGAT